MHWKQLLSVLWNATKNYNIVRMQFNSEHIQYSQQWIKNIYVIRELCCGWHQMKFIQKAIEVENLFYKSAVNILIWLLHNSPRKKKKKKKKEFNLLFLSENICMEIFKHQFFFYSPYIWKTIMDIIHFYSSAINISGFINFLYLAKGKLVRLHNNLLNVAAYFLKLLFVNYV